MTIRKAASFPFLFVLLAAACSSPAGKGVGDAGGNDTDTSGTQSVALDPGLYETSETESAAAWLVAWDGGDAGRLVVKGEVDSAYDLAVTDSGAALTAVPGACEDCPTDAVDVQLTREGGRSWALHAQGEGRPGFVTLRFQPHDGFKPEHTPIGVDLAFEGTLVVATGQTPSQPIFDGACTLTIDADQLDHFACGSSIWSEVEQTTDGPAFATEAGQVAWILRVDDVRIGLVGDQIADDGPFERLEGTASVLDGDVAAADLLAGTQGEPIGYFFFTRL